MSVVPMPGDKRRADELERRAHKAIDRLENEVQKLEQVNRKIRDGVEKKNGVNGDHPEEGGDPRER